MAKEYEITGPDGKTFVIEAPEGASSEQILAFAQEAFKRQGGRIADPAVEAVGQGVRGFNRGLNALISLPGEVVGGAVDLMGGDGDKFRWNNAASRFLSSPEVQPQTTVGRYANAVGQAVGAAALPQAALVGQAGRLAALRPTTTLGAVGQQIGQTIARNPGAATAADATAAAAGGIGSQTAIESGAPAAAPLAGMAAALAPSAAIGAFQTGTRTVRQSLANQGRTGAYEEARRGLGQTVDELGRRIAVGGGSGGRGAANREFALRVLGEEMARANGNVARARQATIQRLASERGVTNQTAENYVRSLDRMYRNNPLMFGELPSVTQADEALRGPGGGARAPENVNLDDLKAIQQTGTRRLFDALAVGGNKPSANVTRNAITARNDQLDPTVRAFLGRVGPQAGRRPATIVDADDMITRAAAAASQDYRSAHSGAINTQLAQRTMPRLVRYYEQVAQGRAGDVRDAIRRAVSQFTDERGQAFTTLRQLQDARTVIRGHIDGYMIDPEKRRLVGPVQNIYNSITRLMSQMSPQWAHANRQWADMSFDELGRRLGDVFSKRAGPRYRRDLAEFRDLNPQAKDIVRIHWLQRVLDDLDNAGDTHSVSKHFTKDHVRNTVRALFGDDAVVDFTRLIRNVRTAEGTFSKNSMTAERIALMKEREIDPGVTAAVENMSIAGVRQWIMNKAKNILTERRDRPLAGILTTPSSDVNRVAMHLENMRRSQQRVQQFSQPGLNPQPTVGVGGAIYTADDE